MPRVFIVEDPSPNAFATGRDPEHAVVATTTGLLQILDRTELEGVMAHELAHVGNRDMLVMTVAVVLAGFIAIVADFFLAQCFMAVIITVIVTRLSLLLESLVLSWLRSPPK